MDPRSRRLARANRGITAAILGGGATALALAVPDPAAREPIALASVMAVGYGHLLGAVVGRWPVRRPAHRSPRRARAWLAWTPAGVLAAAFLPELLLPLLAVSVWHTLENDRALPTAFGTSGRLAPLPRSFSAHAPALAASVCAASIVAGIRDSGAEGVAPVWARPLAELAGVLGAAAALACAAVESSRRQRRAWLVAAVLFACAPLRPRALLPASLTFADVLALTSGYHLVQWGVLQLQRLRRAPDAAAGLRLLAVHALPGSLYALCWWVPEALPSWLRSGLLSPSAYLYAAGLHVLHTAVRRGLAPPDP